MITAVARVLELDELEQLVGAVGGVLRREREQPALELEQLAAGLARVEARLLERDADAPADRVGVPRDVDAGHAGAARR